MVCETVNLSESGLLLIPPFSADPGLSLRVDLPLPGLKRPLALPAVLVREGEHDGRYAWGVRFEAISAAALNFLREFLKQQLADQLPDDGPTNVDGVANRVFHELVEGVDLGQPGQQPATVEPAIEIARPQPPKQAPIDRSAARRVKIKRRTGSQPRVGQPESRAAPPAGQPTHSAQPSARPESRPAPPAGQPTQSAQPSARPESRAAPPAGQPTQSAQPSAPPESKPAPPPGQPTMPPPAVMAPPPARPTAASLPDVEILKGPLIDKPPVQEESTPAFDDVPEWKDPSELDLPRGASRDLMEETAKSERHLDRIYKEAMVQLDTTDPWSKSKKKKKKKKKKGWFD
jgi:hypothetical protein